MKKKYLLMSIVALFMFFGYMSQTKAVAAYCTYKSFSTENVKLRVQFEVTIKDAKRAKITGDVKNDEDVVNWKSNFGGFQAEPYFLATGECPKYAVVVKVKQAFGLFGLHSYRLYVSDEYHFKEKYEENGKEKKGVIGEANSIGHYWISKLELVEEPMSEPEKETPTSCLDFTKNGSIVDGVNEGCENNKYFACVWNETGNNDEGYCNTDKLQYVKCGDAYDIPHELPGITSFFVTLLKIGAPIILIIVSVITLLKALAASKEDEIKKAQNSLIKKVIAAVMVFFIVTIVQFVITLVADSSESGSVSACLGCFLNNDCEDTLYYKTNVGGTDICTYLNGSGNECHK